VYFAGRLVAGRLRVINLPKLASILPLIVALAQGKGGALMGFLTLYQASFESTAAAATG
jgi:hypothetical protein